MDLRALRRDLKRKALARDDEMCQFTSSDGSVCSATTELTLHHIVPLRAGGGDVLENVVIWCRPCHEAHNWAESPPGRRRKRKARKERRREILLGFQPPRLTVAYVTLCILFLLDPEAWEEFRQRFAS